MRLRPQNPTPSELLDRGSYPRLAFQLSFLPTREPKFPDLEPSPHDTSWNTWTREQYAAAATEERRELWENTIGETFGLEDIRAGTPYLIVGLSDGITESEQHKAGYRVASGNLVLAADSKRYVEYLVENDGFIVLFDAPNMLGKQDEKWEQAAVEMGLRMRGVASELQARGRFQTKARIVKASALCAKNPERFRFLFEEISRIVAEDDYIRNKIDQIIPPSAKKTASCEEGEIPPELREYEILHLAFILFCEGEKVRHGRSEERTAQIVKRLKANYSERLDLENWEGNIINPPSLRAKRISKYPLPYRISQVDSTEDVEKILGIDGQMPLSATVRIADNIREFTEAGKDIHLKKYLAKNFQKLKVLSNMDFNDPHEVAIATVLIMNEVWEFEYMTLKTLYRATKYVASPGFGHKAIMKLRGIVSDMCLSPRMKAIIEVLMPEFCGDFDESRVRHFAKQILERFSFDDSPLFTSSDGIEKGLLRKLLLMVRDIYHMVWDEPIRVNCSWWRHVVEIDQAINGGDFTSQADSGILAMPEEREAQYEKFRASARRIILEGDCALPVHSTASVLGQKATPYPEEGKISEATKFFFLVNVMLVFMVENARDPQAREYYERAYFELINYERGSSAWVQVFTMHFGEEGEHLIDAYMAERTIAEAEPAGTEAISLDQARLDRRESFQTMAS